MKILKLHIENYGGLSDLDMNFKDGINEIFESNGYGKTTLASFIKAMFYGLAPCRLNAKDFNDRRKYFPFSGGKFGGNIEFEKNGDIYRIERFFGKKSDTDDELKVYKNAAPTSELGDDIGMKLFGLDEESFLRTLFIDSEITEISSTGRINGLLGDFASQSFDGAGYESALLKLETARKKYKAAKGNNDLISKTQAEISELKTKIENIEKEGESLDGFYAELGKAEEEEKKLGKILKAASEKNVEIEKWKTYDKTLSAAEEKRLRLKEFSQKYSGGVPEGSEIEKIERLILYAENAKAKREAITFDESKKTRLQTYTQTFTDGAPSKDDFLRLGEKIKETNDLLAEADKLGGEQNGQTNKFAGVDVGSVIAELDEAAEKYRDGAALLDNLQNAEPVSKKEKKNGAGLVVTIVSFFAAAVGAAMAFLTKDVMRYAGFAVAAAGVIGLIFGIVKLSKGEKAENKNTKADKIAELKTETEKYADEMKEILVPLGYYSRNGVMFDYAKCKSDIEEYLRTGREKEERRKRYGVIKAKLDGEIAALKRYFAAYGVFVDERSLGDGLYKLKNMADDYSRLAEEQRSFEQINKAYFDKETGARREVSAFFSRYGLLVDGDQKRQLKNLEADLSEIERLKRECAELRKSAEEYKAANSLETRPEGESTDIGDISERLKSCQKTIAIKRGEISDAESIYETLPDYKSRLEEAEEKLAEYKEKRAIIALAEEYLKTADGKLQQKYVAPIKDKFTEFSAPIEKTLGEKVVMDKNFRIYFESGGEIRDEKHLSSGQRCILSLCFRMSLIDNAFGGDKPFIIMDDPFVNLDKKHIEKTVEFLKNIAKDEQIIYLCCHESRKIGAE